MKRIFAAVLVCLLAVTAHATITWTVNVKDMTGVSVASRALVRVTMQRCGANVPRVVGTGVIVPSTQDFKPNSSGAVSMTLYSASEVLCGGNTGVITYRVSYMLDGRDKISADYYATASGDLSEMTPVAVLPVVEPPTGDTTYLRIDGGNLADFSMSYAHISGTYFEKWALTDIQAVIDALPASGGTVRLLPNHEYSIACGVNQVNTGSKVVRIVGDPSSVVSGSGCTLITLASSHSILESFTVKQTVAHDLTVGVLVGTGTTDAVTDWSVNHLYFESTDKLKGTALKTQFGLEGTVVGGEARGWNCGVKLTGYDTYHRSNANTFTAWKSRWGNTGFCIPADSVDNAFLVGNIIEGNSVNGISAASGMIDVAFSHLEQNGDATHPHIDLLGDAHIFSHGNFYGSYPVNANMDIRVASGNTSPQKSDSDILNDGITHDGVAAFKVEDPVIAFTHTGTGTLVIDTPTQKEASDDNYAYTFKGFAQLDVEMPIVNNAGDLAFTVAATRKFYIADSTSVSKALECYPNTDQSCYVWGKVTAAGGLDANNAGITNAGAIGGVTSISASGEIAGGTVKLNDMNQGNHVLCEKSDKSIGYCSSVVANDGTCTCN